MKRRALLTWLGGLPVHAAAQKRGSDAPRPVDLMPDFWSAYDQSYGSSLDRASALRRGFLEKHAETYAKAGLAIPELPVLQKWLGDIAPLVSLMRVIHLRFPLAHDSAMKSFRSTFQDFDQSFSPVYLMPSLLRFDAHLEPVGGSNQLPLFFGADGIARFHGASANLAVLFAHELFHCYHAQTAPDLMLDPAPPVYAAVWTEGLATWISRYLNPHASDLEVLLDDRRLVEAGPRVVQGAAREMLTRIDSRLGEDIARYLSFGAKGVWPARIGYYVGFLIATDLAKTRSAREMAMLKAAEVREIVREVLRRLSANAAGRL